VYSTPDRRRLKKLHLPQIANPVTAEVKLARITPVVPTVWINTLQIPVPRRRNELILMLKKLRATRPHESLQDFVATTPLTMYGTS
jgi:hypothetical protein